MPNIHYQKQIFNQLNHSKKFHVIYKRPRPFFTFTTSMFHHLFLYSNHITLFGNKSILIEVLINISCIYKLKELFLSPAKELMKATN